MSALGAGAHLVAAMQSDRAGKAQQAAIDIALELKGAKLKARLARIEARLELIEETLVTLEHTAENIERLLIERKGVKRGT